MGKIYYEDQEIPNDLKATLSENEINEKFHNIVAILYVLHLQKYLDYLPQYLNLLWQEINNINCDHMLNENLVNSLSVFEKTIKKSINK